MRYGLLAAAALLCFASCSKSRSSCGGDPADPEALALIDAAVAGNEAEVEALLKRGANARHVDGRKSQVLGIATCSTALHRTAAKGYCSIARKLIAAGSNIEHQDIGGWRPLHSAVQSGKIDCVRALVEARADINARSELGYTPLREAIPVGDTEIIGLLLDAGANPDIKDSRGESPRQVSRRFGGEKIRAMIDK